MSRVRLTLIALGMAFALPALTGADVSPATPSADQTVCAPQHSDDLDSRWVWRLRAYHHLDCVTAIVDSTLARNGAAGSEQIAISRADLERIRTLAWQARDAAARIGQ
jgi:hypothetical protein